MYRPKDKSHLVQHNKQCHIYVLVCSFHLNVYTVTDSRFASRGVRGNNAAHQQLDWFFEKKPSCRLHMTLHGRFFTIMALAVFLSNDGHYGIKRLLHLKKGKLHMTINFHILFLAKAVVNWSDSC